MKRGIIIAILSLLLPATALAQYADPEDNPAFVSRQHPGKLVRYYDQFYMNGERIKSYHMVNVLPLMDYSDFAKAHRQYKASEYIAFTGAVTMVTGGAFIAMHKTFPEKFPDGLGQALAIGGVTAIFAVAIPMDFNAQSKLRRIAQKYNREH